MVLKVINLTIPENSFIGDIGSFSPEENYLMLKIGSSCLLEGRKVVAGLSQNEIYQKIKEESKNEICKLEMSILLEKETAKKMEEKITRLYEGQIDQMKKQLDLLCNRIKTYEDENTVLVQKEIEKYREKYELLLSEKDRQNQLNRDAFDKATKLLDKTQYKSSKDKGDDGEDQLSCYLEETFKDFNGYRLENKAKQGHKGDFHLFFDQFNILIDSKNYKSSVQKKEVDKIEHDLSINDNMNFAWLISLESNICDWNRFPIMNKWISTDKGIKCIIYVNNLMDYKDPKNMLRTIWNICNEFNRLTKEIKTDDSELQNYKDREKILQKKIKNLQERTSEMRRNINITLSFVKNMDTDLIELLSLVSNEIMHKEYAKYSKINEWWDNNIEYTECDNKILSTEIWNKFKKENKEYVSENNISIELFKEHITKIVDSSLYVEKTKKGAIEFIGFKFKTDQNIDESKIELELNEKFIGNKTNKK